MAGLDNAGLVIEPAIEADNAADRAAITSRCFDTFTTPAVGQVISGTLESYVMATRNASLLFVDYESGALSFFRLLLTSYDPETFEFEGRCTEAQGSVESSGWFVRLVPGPVSGGGIAPTSVTFIDSTEAQDTAVGGGDILPLTLPSDIQAGDLIVVSAAGLQDCVIDESFSLVASAGSPRDDFLWVKLADGSEGSASIDVTFRSSVAASALFAQAAVFRPDVPAVSFVVRESAGGVISSGSPRNVDSSPGATPFVVLACYAQAPIAATNTIAGGSKLSIDDGSVKHDLDYRLFSTSPADVSISVSSNRNVVSAYIELTAPTTEPGDTAVFEDDGLGNPRYPAADGGAITGIFRATHGTFSGQSSVGIALPLKADGSSYRYHTLDFHVTTGTDAADLYLRTDSGATAGDSGASDYAWQHAFSGATGPYTTNGAIDAAASEIELIDNIGNAAAEYADIKIEMRHFSNGAVTSKVMWEAVKRNSSGTLSRVEGVGERLAALADDFVRLSLSGGAAMTGFYDIRGYD